VKVRAYTALRKSEMKNITLSIDDKTLKVGREYAHSHNISFNMLVRQLIERAVVPQQDQWIEDILSLMDKANVNSGHTKWKREELYRV